MSVSAYVSSTIQGFSHAPKVVKDKKVAVGVQPVTTKKVVAPVTAAPQPTKPTPAPVVTSPKPTAVVTPTKVVTSPTPAPVVTPAPSSNVSSLTPTPTQTTTPTPTTQPQTTGYSSTNWSGYMATTGSFTAISGSWTVPHVTQYGTSTSADATWIGIGGVSKSDLIQVGTENTVSATGVVTSGAFYELLPAAAQIITTLIISPGDMMHASILQTATSQWTILITNITTGQSFTTSVTYSSTLSSAEWIEEVPTTVAGKLFTLDNFGTVSFSQASATNGGTVVNLVSATAEPITMVSNNVPIATPSAIGSGGASFSVTRGQ